MSERPIIAKRQMGNFSGISWREHFTFGWDDDDVDDESRFFLDQHAVFDFYSASSLKQQFAGRSVSFHRHIILIQSQPVFDLTP